MTLAILALGATGMLLVEGAVRVRQWMIIGRTGTIDEAFTIDPETGLRGLVPNFDRGRIRINALGFRSPELAQPKPPGVVRVAFLGGSTTYCAEVSGNELTWPHLVWQSLSAAFPAVRFDYVNAGVPGYGFDSILRNFTQRVQRLEPDVVVIYEAANDLAMDSRQLAREQHLVADALGEDGWLARHSLFWLLVEKNVRIWRLQASAERTTGKLVFDPGQLSRGFEQRLRDTIRAAQRGAAVVAVATFAPRLRRDQSAAEQRRAAVTSLYYMPHMTIAGLVAGFEEYNRVIRAVATETGAVLIAGDEQIAADDLHYADSVHFRDAGSRAMAARVTQALSAAPPFQTLVSCRAAALAPRP
jgi:lysophospholipase L1-like esterase